ncbi:TetR/AcrR family transcriptional regulator [Paractinoplanes lichenicola]|uniref:TetR/AcrR family transcriptional regulator n=1 Tax=Paractinoplanes lichenicola TaxID=2802976 RepID=A0ABS1VZ48_9ACTN|nr:TetR/AcrR family transcriptional regulator [Actinoplanes lichenicola]MBL7259772.1 TetR/AcrR family transcriptional regulator [Actinoplanes lichenicola]
MATARPLRADAQRNRDAILAAARETFDAEGVLASLDGIALRAGVGNATLYRNFPTRDDLLAAVMQTSIAAALTEADELARTRTPRDALAEWLVRLTWQLRIWHDLPYCLASAHCADDSPMKPAADPLLVKTGELLAATESSFTPDEVYELVLALSWAVDRFSDDEATARRRVAMATAGILGSA